MNWRQFLRGKIEQGIRSDDEQEFIIETAAAIRLLKASRPDRGEETAEQLDGNYFTDVDVSKYSFRRK